MARSAPSSETSCVKRSLLIDGGSPALTRGIHSFARGGRRARQSVGDRAGGRRFLHLVRRLRVPTSGVRPSTLDCPEAVGRERQLLAVWRLRLRQVGAFGEAARRADWKSSVQMARERSSATDRLNPPPVAAVGDCPLHSETGNLSVASADDPSATFESSNPTPGSGRSPRLHAPHEAPRHRHQSVDDAPIVTILLEPAGSTVQ